MAEAFIGQRVLVTLKVPEGRQVEGVVAQVLADTSTLVLRNALFRDSGHRFVTWTVMGAQIAELSFSELAPKPIPTASRVTEPVRQNSLPVLAGPQHPVDPAIVTFSKRHSVSHLPEQPIAPHEAPTSPLRQKKPEAAPVVSPVIPVLPLRSSKRKLKVEDAATLNAPFSGLDITTTHTMEEDSHGSAPSQELLKVQKARQGKGAIEPPAPVAPKERPTRSAARRAKASKHTQDNEDDDTVGGLRHKPVGSVNYRGKGWRQTPILKNTKDSESEINGIASTSHAKKGKNRKKGRKHNEELAGWATEDATDIQELPEFDFADNLAKFDKRGVFEQLRKEDTVAAEDRLVGHNRLKKPLWIGTSRPGTFGGKNLHPSENVLDASRSQPIQPPTAAKSTTSRRGSNLPPTISSDSESDQPEIVSSSRISSRSRVRRVPTRNSSNQYEDPPVSGPMPRSAGRPVPRPGHEVSSGSNGILPRLTPSESELPRSRESLVASPEAASSDNFQFRLHPSNHVCPAITPGGMTALEDLADSEQSLGPDIMNENAGRSLADIIVRTLRSTVHRRGTPISAIFLVGNHRKGARAIAAARHLRARGATCVCCVLGLDRPGQDLTPEVEKQIDRLGGAEAVIANWREVQKFLLHSEGKGEFADVLIDALLAPGHTYDTLVPEEQIAVREITSWANNSPAGTGSRGRLVMSIDVPCGINASTGEVTTADDGTRLQMRPRHIISMGAPRVGLLAILNRAWDTAFEETNSSGTISSHVRAILGAKLWVVDIGINRVWRTYGEEYGLASGTGVKFGMEWFSLLRVDDDDDDDDENDDDR